MKTHRVPDGVQPLRLARYLSRAWPTLPGAALRGALRAKDVRINGVRSGADALVCGGDELTLYLPDHFFEAPVRVLFEDEQLLALDKPPGLPVDVDADSVGADTLLSRLRSRYPEAQLCHRLDTDTGGALLCARTPDCYEQLLAAFAARQVEKVYQAVVRGCPSPDQATLAAYLVKDATHARVRVMDGPAMGALSMQTGYRVLRPNLSQAAPLALVEVLPLTGRTHQIRAHMAHIGNPLLGDDKYGDRALNRALRVKSPQLWCVELRIQAGGALSRYRDMRFISEPHFLIQ